MKQYKSIIFPAAEVAIREARTWYREISPALSVALKREIDEIIQKVVGAPTSYGVRFQDVRRINLQQFPYAFFYTIKESEHKVIFLRFFHIKMNMPYSETEGPEITIHEP